MLAFLTNILLPAASGSVVVVDGILVVVVDSLSSDMVIVPGTAGTPTEPY